MHLLLTSWGIGALPGFLARALRRPAEDLSGLHLVYVDDAAAAYADQPWASVERDRLTALGARVTVLRCRGKSAEEVAAALDGADAVYLCGGNTFVLAEALRTSGADAVLRERVAAGLPYVGLSAGSAVAGTDLAPVALMDDESEAPDLADLPEPHRGLGVVDGALVPHADGGMPPYPPSLIAQVVAEHTAGHRLRLLRDDEALLVDDDGVHLVPSP